MEPGVSGPVGREAWRGLGLGRRAEPSGRARSARRKERWGQRSVHARPRRAAGPGQLSGLQPPADTGRGAPSPARLRPRPAPGRGKTGGSSAGFRGTSRGRTAPCVPARGSERGLGLLPGVAPQKIKCRQKTEKPRRMNCWPWRVFMMEMNLEKQSLSKVEKQGSIWTCHKISRYL